MHLHVVIAFALLMWWANDRPFGPLVSGPGPTWGIVVGQMIALWLLARWSSARALAAMDAESDGKQAAQHVYHRNLFLLRVGLLISLGIDLTVTRWPEWVQEVVPLADVPGVGDLIILLPFLVGSVMVLTASYPVDRAIREMVAENRVWQGLPGHKVWNLRSYLEFNVRHQLLTVVVPMFLILAVYRLTRQYEEGIRDAIPLVFAPDILLGVAAGLVFLAAPWLLKHVWITRPLGDGPLRRRLEALCGEIGLRCADILVWNSAGMVVNAAVMGLVRPVRYVMLSDALLESMNGRQIEAVFGHEAGHVRHAHIPFFLLFAVASMLAVAGLMEGLLWLGSAPGAWIQLDTTSVQAIGFVSILVLWGLVFGFISRRFERQADLFGARCVTPRDGADCPVPCGVHGDAGDPKPRREALCATAAATFCQTLDRVALLNGIPAAERSWRHSSIASRIGHLTALAGDLNRLRSFERRVRAIKYLLVVVCVAGLAGSAYYVWQFPGTVFTVGK